LPEGIAWFPHGRDSPKRVAKGDGEFGHGPLIRLARFQDFEHKSLERIRRKLQALDWFEGGGRAFPSVFFSSSFFSPFLWPAAHFSRLSFWGDANWRKKIGKTSSVLQFFTQRCAKTVWEGKILRGISSGRGQAGGGLPKGARFGLVPGEAAGFWNFRIEAPKNGNRGASLPKVSGARGLSAWPFIGQIEYRTYGNLSCTGLAPAGYGNGRSGRWPNVGLYQKGADWWTIQPEGPNARDGPSTLTGDDEKKNKKGNKKKKKTEKKKKNERIKKKTKAFPALSLTVEPVRIFLAGPKGEKKTRLQKPVPYSISGGRVQNLCERGHLDSQGLGRAHGG